MTDRYRGYSAAGRSAAFNPARLSLPAGVGGYGALYSSDTDIVASPTRYAAAAATPRGYTTAATAAGIAAPPRPYTTVNAEPRAPRPSAREPSRSRRSTVDTNSRPPIIVTTMQDHRPHTSATSHAAEAHAHTHAGSPIREAYRSSDGRLYAQPASSIRSRSTARPYHTSSVSEDFGRSLEQGEIVLASHDADAYRSSRPHVVYPSNSRHSNAAIDYGDDGYQYTNTGELVRYDLDHGGAPPARSRRRESLDRSYSRPNVNYNADQRSLNVNSTLDPNRPNRTHESRGGPPPSTRGFDKIGRGYDVGRDVPPAAPVPPTPTSSGLLEPIGGTSDQRTVVRRPRPLSLTQEPGARSTYPEEYHRGYDADGSYEPRRYYDDSVTSRGFGVKANPSDDIDDHRGRYWDPRGEPGMDDSARREPPRKRIELPVKEGQRPHDEENRETDRERESWYRNYRDNLRDRLDGRRDGDQEDGDRSRVRDKIDSGLGVAAATAGLSPNSKRDERAESVESRRRRNSNESAGREDDRERRAGKTDEEVRERYRREAEARLNGDSVAAASASDSDDGRKRTARRHRPSSVFDPNDTGDLRQIREQLAAVKTSDSDKAETHDRSSPAKEDRRSESPSGDDSRGRDLVVVRSPEEKQVRVVSPPREKKEEKPLKGILKQPKASFPEELNPVREGVAPHKEDKKLKEVPPGARWTKINRKIVNPEALEIGKERYEVRDDFVIVLRVLSKEEIQTYAAATQVLRERRRNKDTGEPDSDRNSDRDRDAQSQDYDREYDREYDEEQGRGGGHRHRRYREDAEGPESRDPDRDRNRDRERRRRHRRDEEEEYESRSKDLDHHHHHRSHREA